ncbi:MAG: FlgD immunoglobulin-like domain containing protein [Candidatus Desantisbacteria bacterium]
MNYLLIIIVVFILSIPYLSSSEVIRNGGDNSNSGVVDQPGDVIMSYNDGLSRFVSSNVVETIILTPVAAISTTQVIYGEDNKTMVEISPDNFVTTTYISVMDQINTPQLFEEQTQGLKIELAEAGDPSYKKIDSTIRIFSAYDEQGTITQNFNEQVAITIPYPDINQDGIVDGTMVGETSLKMYALEDGGWVEVQGGTIDTAANIFTASVWHFSVYELRGIPFAKDLSRIYAYPNPFNPCLQGKITFAELTDTAEIRIFTIAGELVKTIEVTPQDSGKPTWDGRNEAGERVASGIYLYVIISEEGYKAVGKIGIIK